MNNPAPIGFSKKHLCHGTPFARLYRLFFDRIPRMTTNDALTLQRRTFLTTQHKRCAFQPNEHGKNTFDEFKKEINTIVFLNKLPPSVKEEK